MKQREPSVRVGDDWKVIEEIEFSRLSKLSLVVDDPVDLYHNQSSLNKKFIF